MLFFITSSLNISKLVSLLRIDRLYSLFMPIFQKIIRALSSIPRSSKYLESRGLVTKDFPKADSFIQSGFPKASWWTRLCRFLHKAYGSCWRIVISSFLKLFHSGTVLEACGKTAEDRKCRKQFYKML